MDKQERYEHTHTPGGFFLNLGVTQDAVEPTNCATCGRTTRMAWNHAFDCPSYQPHGASIASQRLSGARSREVRS